MDARLYTRVSHEDQVKFGLSLDAQEKSLREYCSENNLNIIQVYSDEGISGGSLDKRKSFTKMIKDSKPGEIILFTKLDRFSRNLLDANIIVKELDKKNVSIKAIHEDDIDTSTADGKFMFNLKLSLAEREREKTSERIKDVNKYKVKAGLVTTGKYPFGYYIKDKKLVVDKEKAEMIVKLFKKYQLTQSINVVMRWWNAEYPEYSLCRETMKNRLRSTFYIGKHPSGLNDNYCEPILSEELFYDVSAKLAANIKVYPSKQNNVYIFTGLIVCKECGRTLIGKSNCIGSLYYRCARGTTDRTCSNINSISQKKLEKYLLDDLNKRFNERLDVKFKKRNQRVNRTNEIEILKAKISRLKDLYVDGLIDRDKFDTKYQQLTSQIKALEVENEQSNLDKLFDSMVNVTIEDIYDHLSDENKRVFWRNIIARIEHYKHEFNVVYY